MRTYMMEYSPTLCNDRVYMFRHLLEEDSTQEITELKGYYFHPVGVSDQKTGVILS